MEEAFASGCLLCAACFNCKGGGAIGAGLYEVYMGLEKRLALSCVAGLGGSEDQAGRLQPQAKFGNCF